MVFTAKINGLTKPIKSMGKIVHWGNVEIPRLSMDVAEDGAMFLQRNMPHDTGAMQRAVDFGGRRGRGWAVISRIPKGQKAKNRPYHIYYNQGARGGRRTPNNSGKIGYYQKTYSYLERKYPEMLKNSLSMTIRQS